MHPSRNKAAKPTTPIPTGTPISALAPSPRQPGLFIIRVGRKRAGLIDAAQADALGIGVGALWTDDLAAAVTGFTRTAEARTAALRLLARRSMSRRRLLDKLRQRAIDPAAAESIADDLTRRGLLDDERYARALVESELARKPAGRSLLIGKLRQRGIEPALANTIVNEAVTDDSYNAREQALTLARRRIRVISARADPEAVRRRLYAQLARRGFGPDVCRSVIDEVAKDANLDARPSKKADRPARTPLKATSFKSKNSSFKPKKPSGFNRRSR